MFFSTLGLTEELASKVEIMCMTNDFSSDRLVIVSEKDFGGSNVHFYAKRNQANFFEQTIKVKDDNQFVKQNQRFAKFSATVIWISKAWLLMKLAM